MDFSNRLKQLRNKEDIYQKELADRLGVSRSTITAWEAGKREPDFATVQKLADYFNVTTDYLLGRTDNPKGILDEPTEMEIEHVLKNNQLMLDGEVLTEDRT